MKWIATQDLKWYVHELRGVVYVSFVAEKDRRHAMKFEDRTALEWASFLDAPQPLVVRDVEDVEERT